MDGRTDEKTDDGRKVITKAHPELEIRFAKALPTQSMHQSENIKIKLITMINKGEYSWLILLYARVTEKQ